jgi:hypothetical protein
MLNDKKIISSFRKERLNGKNLIDFLPRIREKAGNKILQSWMIYFQGLNVPYAVTETDGIKTLWKEDIARSELMRKKD